MPVHLTAKVKVHNPSRRKRAILDRALEEYTRAFAELLAWAKDNMDVLEEKGRFRGRFTETAIRSAFPNPSALNHYHLHSSARDALWVDVAGTLCSYFRLREENSLTAFPTCRDPSPETYPDALNDFAAVLDDEQQEKDCRARLLRVARGSVMPIYFSRPDAVPRQRNFSLLHDPQRQRYYALLYLEPGANNSDSCLRGKGNLVRVGWPQNKAATDPKPVFRAKAPCAVLLPLALGDWHVETFLSASLRGDANVRSAFLSRREREGSEPEYYVHITFEFSPERVQTETALGVDRGLANLIALTVTDEAGKILHQELHPGRDLIDYQKYVYTVYRSRQKRGRSIAGQVMVARVNEEVCHRLANVIVETAVEHKSQVVMENLKWFKERRRDFGQLKRAPLQRIQQILEYKLPMRGLPRPWYENPAYTSRECPRCGYGFQVKGRGVNRPSQDKFKCERCGYQTHADLNGSHNVARRWLQRKTERATTRTLTA